MTMSMNLRSAFFSPARSKAQDARYSSAPVGVAGAPVGVARATPSRYSRPPSPAKGSDSMSKNTSPGSGAGSRASPRSGSTGQEPVEDLARKPAVELDGRLPMDARIGLLVSARGPFSKRGRLFRVLREGRHALPLELRDLQRADAGHQAEVIVVMSPLVALLPPTADVAVFDRVG